MLNDHSLEKRAARRRLSSEERKQEIVSTAAHLFDQDGYSRTSMDDLAKTIGIAKPTLYHYFPSKDHILYDIHEDFIDLLIARHRQRIDAGLRPDQMLLEVMADILELMETHRGHVRVFFEHYRELPTEQQVTISAKRDEYEAAVESIFAEGVADGTFKDLSPRLAAFAMFGMVNWAYQWYRPEGSMRTREVAYTFWSFFVHGIGTGQSTPS